jgi:hypothetical protein
MTSNGLMTRRGAFLPAASWGKRPADLSAAPKPRGRGLAPAERLITAGLSKDGRGGEPSRDGGKGFRSVPAVFRNQHQDVEGLVMEIAGGLPNVRGDHRLTA